MVLSVPFNAAGPQAFPSRPQPRLLNAVPSTTKAVRHPAGQGPQSHVTLQWCKGIPAKDTTMRTVFPLPGLPSLCNEQVRGQKVELEILLPPGFSSLPTVPGGAFDSQDLLRAGRFTNLGAPWRTLTVLPADGGPTQEIPTTTGDVLHSLLAPTWLASLPKRSSSSEMCWSTCQDGMGLNIGGAYFFACPAEGRPFAFSSDHYRYLYMYTFEQIFFTIRADGDGRPIKGSPNHEALEEKKEEEEQALWLHEIKYGRRIYVLIESETALEHHKNGIRSGLEWIMLSAKLQNPSFAANVQTQSRIRLQTQDNQILDPVEIADIQSTLEAYFESPCSEHPLSPLAIQVSELDGTPVSLLTTAFIDSQHAPPGPPIQAGDHGSMRAQPR